MGKPRRQRRQLPTGRELLDAAIINWARAQADLVDALQENYDDGDAVPALRLVSPSVQGQRCWRTVMYRAMRWQLVLMFAFLAHSFMQP